MNIYILNLFNQKARCSGADVLLTLLYANWGVGVLLIYIFKSIYIPYFITILYEY